MGAFKVNGTSASSNQGYSGVNITNGHCDETDVRTTFLRSIFLISKFFSPDGGILEGQKLIPSALQILFDRRRGGNQFSIG